MSGPAAPRRRRGPLALAIGLAVLAVLAAAACTRWPVPDALVERLLSSRLHREVRIDGDASFCLCPVPSIRATAIEVGPPDWSDQPFFARATDVDLRLWPGTLLGRTPRVVSLEIGHGEAILERTEDGRASWQFPRDDRGADAAPIRIERLEALDVAWRLIDPARGADLRGTLSLLDGAGRPGPDGQPVAPRLEVRAEGTLRGLASTVAIDGGGVLPEAHARARPLRLRARVGDGRLSFDGEVDALASLDGLRGGFTVTGPALAALGGLFGAVLPRTPPFRIEGRVRHAGERWELDVADARVGDSDLRGTVAFVPGGERRSARLEGTLRSQRMRIADLGRSVGFGERPRRRDPGRVLPDVSLDLPSLRDMDARVGMTIDQLELGASTQPITALRATLRLENGVLAVGEIDATVAGGRLGGELRLDATDKPGRLDAALRIREVALHRWLPKLRGEPPIASRLNADMKLAGRGDSVADVLARADGSLRVALGPGRASRLLLELAGLDVAESLAVLTTRDRAVPLDCGLAELSIERGVARPKVMIVDTRDTVLSADGSIDLSKERIAMRVRAAPRDFSPLTVRSPIDVGGTFADPTVRVDRTRVAGTLIASVVLGAVVAPLAALVPLLDFGEGDPPSPCAERYRGRSAGPQGARR